jgi:hypothetical protein
MKIKKKKIDDKLITAIIGIIAGSYISNVAKESVDKVIDGMFNRKNILLEVYDWLEKEYIHDKRMNLVHSAFYEKFLKRYEGKK